MIAWASLRVLASTDDERDPTPRKSVVRAERRKRQSGEKALGWSIQQPRPRNPQAATAQEQGDFKKKNSPKSSRKKRKPIPAFPSRRFAPTSTVSG